MNLRQLYLPIVLAVATSFVGCRTTTPPNDTALNSAVEAKLHGDSALSSEPIQTSVQGGVATLQGAVSSEAARALAANEAAQVSGIHSVNNLLTIKIPLQASAQPLSPPVTALVPSAKPTRPVVRRQEAPAAVARRPYASPPPAQSATAAPIERRAPDLEPPQQSMRPQQPPPAPAFRNVTIPSGTALPVRITQTLSSATAQPGDTFSGSIASDVVIDGVVALPAGTTVSGRVDQVQEAAHFKGSALLTVSLTSINRRGERATIATEPYTEEGKGRGKNTATKVGAGAAVGAILGGIFGGGKGAAIGAATGGGVGAGANGITRGEQVQIASETLLRFRLAEAVTVRASTTPADPDANLQRRSGN